MLGTIVLTGYLYITIPKGFFPEQDTGFIFGQAEARQDISATSRRAVPMRELLGVARDSCRQFDGVDPGFLGAV